MIGRCSACETDIWMLFDPTVAATILAEGTAMGCCPLFCTVCIIPMLVCGTTVMRFTLLGTSCTSSLHLTVKITGLLPLTVVVEVGGPFAL